MSKLLVAGATGTIGTELTKKLREAGVAFDVMSSKAGVGRQASYADVASLKQAFAGVDTLFVLLPLVPQKIEFARNVALAAQSAGVKHIVRSSGAGADPNAAFALPKLQGTIDAILADTGIATTFLRPAGFMQNYATFIADQVKRGTVYAASADQAQSLIDARDIAAVAAKVLANPAPHAGRAYTLTGAEALTDSERVRVLSEVLGRPIAFQAVSIDDAAKQLREWGLPPVMVEWMSSLNQVVSAGYAGAVSVDVQTLLGRAPISFRAFARDYAASWKA